jgi:hypothetical protein
MKVDPHKGISTLIRGPRKLVFLLPGEDTARMLCEEWALHTVPPSEKQRHFLLLTSTWSMVFCYRLRQFLMAKKKLCICVCVCVCVCVCARTRARTHKSKRECTRDQ